MPEKPAHSGPSLRAWLLREGGSVPFRRFMEAALYDADFGYYSRQIRTVGTRGDFSTSATLSGGLALAIAHWVREEAQAHPGICHLIEIGPGNGILHRQLRQSLGWRGRWHWRSHLVESSAVLQAEQRRTLGWLGKRVTWHGDPASALKAAGGKALIFSNELVDAFPATLLQNEGGAWQEVWLDLLTDGRIVETLRPSALPSLGTTLVAENFPEGQRVEVPFSYQEWCRNWQPLWTHGAMLTIDYGGMADGIYKRRPGGSVRGYHQHQRLEGLAIYRNPGHCDLTTDVNFSDLIHWGQHCGWKCTSLQSLADFLAANSKAENLIDRRLQDRDGAGGAFQCLVQRPTGRVDCRNRP